MIDFQLSQNDQARLDLIREQVGDAVEIDLLEGVSLAWGLPGFSRAMASLPVPVARAALQALDGLARRAPSLADVVVVAGAPRHSAIASS